VRNPGYRTAAVSVAEALRGEDGPARVVEALDRLPG
jgi:hypothetical protein